MLTAEKLTNIRNAIKTALQDVDRMNNASKTITTPPKQA